MKKNFGCVISAAVFTAYKIIQVAFNAVAKGLSSLLVATGLIVPLSYFLFGVVLTALFGFSASDGSINAIIYKAGFGVCLLANVLIFIYNVFVRPVKKAHRARIEKHKLEPAEQKPESAPTQPATYTLPPAGISDAPHETAQRIDPNTYFQEAQRLPTRRMNGREMPLIYRSKVHPEIIVYEYSDCFRLYKEDGEKLTLVKVQPKD